MGRGMAWSSVLRWGAAARMLPRDTGLPLAAMWDTARGLPVVACQWQWSRPAKMRSGTHRVGQEEGQGGLDLAPGLPRACAWERSVSALWLVLITALKCILVPALGGAASPPHFPEGQAGAPLDRKGRLRCLEMDRSRGMWLRGTGRTDDSPGRTGEMDGGTSAALGGHGETAPVYAPWGG